jgi:ribosomal protein S1
VSNAKFKIGQMVSFRPVRASVPASLLEYRVQRLLPHEGREQQYRIKSVAEQFERIARESELSRRV